MIQNGNMNAQSQVDKAFCTCATGGGLHSLHQWQQINIWHVSISLWNNGMIRRQGNISTRGTVSLWIYCLRWADSYCALHWRNWARTEEPLQSKPSIATFWLRRSLFKQNRVTLSSFVHNACRQMRLTLTFIVALMKQHYNNERQIGMSSGNNCTKSYCCSYRIDVVMLLTTYIRHSFG